MTLKSALKIFETELIFMRKYAPKKDAPLGHKMVDKLAPDKLEAFEKVFICTAKGRKVK